jgi:hemerythrin-like domain-containing protein
MRQIQEGGPVDEERCGQMIDFIQNCANRCHHTKEEKLLFVRLEERGLPVDGGPIGALLQEHDEGRRFVRSAAEALSRASEGESATSFILAINLLDYARLLRLHIDKKDNVLYPIADQLLTVTNQTEPDAAFDRVEAEEMGEGTHERYHQLVHEWAGSSESRGQLPTGI